MKDKHEQLYVAVQDLLIELGITPEKLRTVAKKETHGYIKPIITAKTAQKLIDADLIVEEIDWRKPINVSGHHQENDSSVIAKDEDLSRQLKSFTDKINNLPVENFPLTTFNKIKSGLAPIILWSYLREEHSSFLQDQIKDYLFPTQ